MPCDYIYTHVKFLQLIEKNTEEVLYRLQAWNQSVNYYECAICKLSIKVCMRIQSLFYFNLLSTWAKAKWKRVEKEGTYQKVSFLVVHVTDLNFLTFAFNSYHSSLFPFHVLFLWLAHIVYIIFIWCNQRNKNLFALLGFVIIIYF